MKKNPKVYLTTLNPSENEFVFFDDTDLKITAKVSRNGQSITSIDFVLDGKTGNKYTIKDINPCNSKGIDWYMVHMYTEICSSERGDKCITNFTAHRNPHLKKLKLKDHRDFALFYFNVFNGDPGGIEFPCKFTGPSPESKDGSIIIGG